MVGIVDRGSDGPKFIPKIWNLIIQRWDEINHRNIEKNSFGVMDNFDKDGFFDYNAGIKINDSEKAPDGMSIWTIPEQEYVVFPCTIPTVLAKLKYIFNEWFPKSDYEPSKGPEFEFYPENFDPQNGNDEFFYYIPIKRK